MASGGVARRKGLRENDRQREMADSVGVKQRRGGAVTRAHPTAHDASVSTKAENERRVHGGSVANGGMGYGVWRTRETGRAAVLRAYAAVAGVMLLAWVSTLLDTAGGPLAGVVNPSYFLLALAFTTVAAACLHAQFQREAAWEQLEAADDGQGGAAGPQQGWAVDSDAEEDAPAMMSESSAMWFPVIGSAMLLGLFVVYTFMSSEVLRALVSIYILYFCATATYFTLGGLAKLLKLFRGWAPVLGPGTLIADAPSTAATSAAAADVKPSAGDPAGAAPTEGAVTDATGDDSEPAFWRTVVWGLEDMTWPDFGRMAAVLALTAAYWFGQDWVTNNLLSVCFCLWSVRTIGMPNIKVGVVLLVGLFFYDVWWVFGSEAVTGHNVMVAVAKGVEAPIKIVHPRPDGSAALLGLGDIVLPGEWRAMFAFAAWCRLLTLWV